MLKILDKHIAKNFIGPSLLSFFVALFVLVMQFLWKYIDEILGKGFTIFDLMELIFYFSITLIPMALPITILISSVMVYGDMAEKYEISSFKSAGVSMVRLLMPGFSIALLIACFSFLSSNFLKPNANFQFQKRMTQLGNQKAALTFEEGIFNNSFDDVLIKIDKINRNGTNISDIIIFDHTGTDKSKINIVKAKEGLMYSGGDGRFFVMELDSGTQYMEIQNSNVRQGQSKSYPFLRTEFGKWEKIFDMSQFELEDGFSQFSRKREEMLNTFQLITSVDSFNLEIRNNRETLRKEVIKKTDPDHSAKSILQKQEKTDPDTSVANTIPSNSIGTDPDQNNPKTEQIKKNWLKLKKDPSGALPKKETPKDKTPLNSIIQSDSVPGQSIYQTIPPSVRSEVLTRAISTLNINRDRWISYGHGINDYNKSKQRYLLHLHQHFSWAAICIIFLFIGAPMGSIIRKGGYGYPFLVAVLFYMIFIISTIFSTKLVRSESMGGMLAAWLPCIIQAPFGFLLTFLALKDIPLSGIFGNFSFVTKIIRHIKNKRSAQVS